MAHRLAADDEHSTSRSRGQGSKSLLNRRTYIKLSGSAVVAGLGLGAGGATASASSGESYQTDFSRYAS